MIRIVASFLLVLMLLQPGAGWLIFKTQQYQIRQEIKHRIRTGLPDTALVLLKIPQAWEDGPQQVFQRIHEREFRFQGKMYDIVRREMHGDTTWYYCVSDEKETELFANLEEMINHECRQNPQRKQQLEKLQQLINLVFILAASQPCRLDPGNGSRPASYQFATQTWTQSPPVPPPEV